MRKQSTKHTNREQRLLRRQVHPWDAGRPTDRQPSNKSQLPNETMSTHGSVLATRPAPQAKTVPPPHVPNPDSYQWIMLIVVSTICMLAAINALAYLIIEQPSSSAQMSSHSTLSSSVTLSTSSSAHVKTSIIHRPAAIVPPSSSATSIQTLTSSSVKSQSTTSVNGIQQLPTTRAQERKLLKAVQDAKRARQNGSAPK